MTPDTRVPNRLRIVGAALVAASMLLGLWLFLRGDDPFGIDTAWNVLLAEWDAPLLHAISNVMNVAGGVLVSSFVVPALAITALMLWKKPWSAGYFITSVAASALAVQLLKHLFGRVRPADILVISDYGSYPSGHVANAATLAAVLVVLVPQVWAVIVGTAWVVLMAFSRTELHAHWLSDTLGGALIGVGVALVAAGFMYRGVHAEQRRMPRTTSPRTIRSE